MKRRPHRLLALLTVALALGASGCVQTSAPVRRPVVQVTRPATYALSISVEGGLPPSPAQWAAIQATFARLLAREGITLVSDLSLADRILRIEFVPDPLDPENRGKAEIVSIRSNPLYGTPATSTPLVASYGGFPYAFGWNSFNWASMYGFGYDSYYGYGNAYYDGYTYATPTLNPRRPCVVDGTPRHRHPEPRTPGDHEHPRRPEPPERRGPPVLAATPPAARVSPAVYPASQPGTLAFPDDLRLARPARLASSGLSETRTENYRGRYEPAAGSNESFRSWLGRSLAAADGQGSSGSTSTPRSESAYHRREGSEASSERSSSRRESTAGYQRSESSWHSSGGSSSSSSSWSSSSGSSSSSYSSSSYSSSSSSSSSYSPPADTSSSSSSSSGSSAGSSTANRSEK